MRWRLIPALAIPVLLAGTAAPAYAELVFFASGRSLSVKAARLDGDSLILSLRSGGEIVCDRLVITRIEPDEVPYPDPAPATPGGPPVEAIRIPPSFPTARSSSASRLSSTCRPSSSGPSSRSSRIISNARGRPGGPWASCS